MIGKWKERRERFRRRREFYRILERSSLAHDELWKFCDRCRKETARDPYDKSICVNCNQPYE